MTRVIKLFFILVLLLFLLGPYVQKRRPFVPDYALTENRLKTNRPKELRLLLANGGRYALKYEEYYNDNYGLRDLFIRLKNQLDFSVFHQSGKVVVGREGWLFYRSVVEELIGIEKAPPRAYATLFSRREKLNRHLRGRGITLVMLPCPTKNTIYPEMLPSNTANRPHPTGFERYRELLKQHPEIITLDPHDMLAGLKGSFNVYHRTDFHWTDPAGAEVARNLVNMLAGKTGHGAPWIRPLGTHREMFANGGENLALALFRPYEEPYLLLDTVTEETGAYHWTAEPNEWSYETRLADSSGLIPHTVMFGDSYGDAFLRAGFTAYFRSFQKFYNYQFRDKYIRIPPQTRFVVFEHIETFLNALLGDALWPEEILQ